ncbi:DUF6529 family protein [Kribbella sp. CWNU-51]
MTTTPVHQVTRVGIPLGVGAAAAVALGVYGRVHDPTGVAINVAGFSSFQSVKAWMATLALLLGVVQVVSAMALFGHFKGLAGRAWVGPLHRWSGRAAVAVTLPVVAHCLYALGFQYGEPRVLIHSLLGCFFYGAFVAKMLTLSRKDSPSWLLPVAGGAVFTALVGLWLTSSLWFFTTFGVIR